jgi:hypothetical protein
METNKTFDAVKMMREIREQLSEKYWKHPEILNHDMVEIRRKYQMPEPETKIKTPKIG